MFCLAVRSLTLDDWEPSWIKLLSSIGNNVSNNVYEELVDESDERITATSSRTKREEWIRWKYVDKRFVRSPTMTLESDNATDTHSGNEDSMSESAQATESLNRSLFQSVQENDIVGVYRSLAAGADVNWKNAEAGNATCLHISVQRPVVELSEFLLLNSAKIDTRDDSGRTAIHLAIQSGIRG